jgi:5-methyltetrahydrofolate--homocysteine methyltransferase
MNKTQFLDILKKRILVLDGGMGFLLQSLGSSPGDAPEKFMLEYPESVLSAHKDYVNAGADIILTNTFGATEIRLQDAKLGKRFRKINRIAVQVAREAAGKKALVGASIGPTGQMLEPMGELSFDEAYKAFRSQLKILTREGIDLIVLETFSDLKEFKAALIAARQYENIPVIAMMTFAKSGRTITGTDPLTFLTVAEALGADLCGANCSTGPKELLPIMKTIAANSTIHLCVEPNAGLPILKKSQTFYKESPERFIGHLEDYIKMGVNVVGGCCGTTPDHIRVLKAKVKGFKPRKREVLKITRLTSRTRNLEIKEETPVLIAGERINPTGKKAFEAELRKGKISRLIKEASLQIEEGAQLLDINVGVEKPMEKKVMVDAVKAVQQTVQVPLIIDSADPDVIEAALREVEGKGIINSVNGSKKSLGSILPLAKRYGAAVVGLCLDEKGIPDTVNGRFRVAEKIVKKALQAGIKLEDIIIDPLTLAASVDPQNTVITLEVLRKVKKELNVKTILGVSNISFGLPERSSLNAAFISMAVAAGLDIAICNPYDDDIKKAVLSSSLLVHRDPHGRAFLSYIGQRKGTGLRTKKKDREKLSVEERISQAVVYGEKESISGLIEEALKSGYDPYKVIEDALIRGVEQVGDLYERNIYYLPQVLLSAETMKKAFDTVKRKFKKEGIIIPKGKIVFATVKGDIHDIGKNICITLLENNGFKVFDLGKDVETEKIVQEAKNKQADIVALSALMTTTMIRMKDIVGELKVRNIPCFTLVGGAVLTPHYAEEIGADGYGRNAIEAVKAATLLMEEKRMNSLREEELPL